MESTLSLLISLLITLTTQVGAEAPVFIAPAPAPPEAGAGLPVLPWIQDRFLKATRSVSANIVHDRTTSASSDREGLDMRLPLCDHNRRFPIRPRAGWFATRGPQGFAPCLFPFRVFYSAGHPTEAGACEPPRPEGRAPMTCNDQERRAEIRGTLRLGKR
jgi:hypothetical protein